MCLICLEFNRSKDFGDVARMLEAARREVNVIPEDHLKKIEAELRRRKAEPQADPNAPLDID